jgi:transposase
MVGVSRQTAWKWLRRYETEGIAGLDDRSSRPARSPRALPQLQVDAILAARHEHRFGPHRLAPIVGLSRSPIGDVLARHGLSPACATRMARPASRSAPFASVPARCSTST